MVNAGASIEAFLKLDASNFNTGIETATTSVTNFKKAMLDVGKEANTFNTGVNSVSKALDELIRKMSLLDSVDSKAVNNFKTMASALLNVATAAQRLSVDSMRGHRGIESLNTIMEVFRSGVSSAEIVVKRLSTGIRTLGDSARESSVKLSESDQVIRNQFQLLDNTLAQTGSRSEEFRVITQRLRNEYGLSGQKLAEVRSQLMQTTQATVQYAEPLTMLVTRFRTLKNEINNVKMMMVSVQGSFNQTSTVISKVNTTLQSWKTLTDSIANSTTQKLSTSVNSVNSTFKNLSTNISKTTESLSHFKSTLGSWMGTLNSTDGTIKRTATGVQQYGSELRIATKWMGENGAETQRYRVLQQGVNLTIQDTINTIRRQSEAMQQNAVAKLRAMGYTGQLSAEEKMLGASEQEVSAKTNQATSSLQRQNMAYGQATNSTRQLASATKGLGRAFSSLKMIGTMVGSMMVWNFAHSLVTATRETVNAKSEMNGYFQMLHFTQGQIDDFNKSLDQTVQLFPRLNKYALGETISSIGVEFELTTEEMKKAMPVVSMITSEYLRAGRNVNEASLAVKDILQGEFQRLSRETGVKGDQLKEAGWSGDKNDVMGLLDALDKVGRSRNWDTFVAKANSLNDAVLILQNRFSEWSADMVEAVQPTIVGVFNALMGVAEGFATTFSGVWEWLNSGSWESTAVNIGMLGGAILTVSQALVMYRGQMGLVQASQLGLSKSIGTLIFGLKGEELAHVGVINSIKAKILGVEAETIAERGTATAIKERRLELELEAIQERINGATTKENTLQKELNALQTKLSALSEEGLIGAKAKETIEEDLNTVAKELNTISTTEQGEANTGLLATIYGLIYGEEMLSAETGVLTAMWEILTGVFMMTPIGWVTGLVLGLAGAFYVLTGGLDDGWSKMQTFNDNVQKGNDALKPYWNNVSKTSEELEKAKEQYGENSQQVKDLEDKLKYAKDSFEGFRESLQKGVKTAGALNDELEQLEPNLDAITRKNFGELNLDTKEVDEYLDTMDAMGYGREKSYTALQKLVAMEGNFYDNQQKAIPILTEHNRSVEEGAKNLGNYNDKYKEFIEHSTEANKAEDWWTWMWESFYASQSKGSADATIVFSQFENIFRDLPDTLRKWIDDATSGEFLSDTGAKLFGDFGKWLGDGFNSAFSDFNKWLGDADTSLNDSWNDLQEMWNNNIAKPLGEMFGNFIADPLGSLGLDFGGVNLWDMLMNAIFPAPVSAEDGGEHPSFMEDLSAIFGFDVQTWINNFTTDPLGTLGIDLSGFDLVGTLTNFIFGNNDGSTDPNDISWLNNIFSGLTPENILNFVNTNIIAPFSQGIQNGIANIPIIGSIAQMLGLISQDDPNAQDEGSKLMRAFGNGVTTTIGQIPIIGDIARMLGLIPQENPDAHSKGKGVGDSLKDGVMNGLNNLGSQVIQEFNDALGGIGKLGEEAYNTAKGWADQLWQGVNSILQRHSPGFFHDQFQLEFGQDIPNAITEAGSTAYTVAQAYGQSIKDGISETSFNTVGFDNAVGIYQDDAQIVADSSQYMGTTTATAFNQMTTSVNQSTTQMQGNVATSYSSMQQKQQSSLNTMRNQNLQAYNDMYLKSNQSLIQMRDSTSNVTHQMTNAWSHMKDQIVASANKLKSDSTSHFNQLSNTIGGFYRKIQNPSNWGAGAGTPNIRGARNSTAGRGFAKTITRGARHGAGSSSLYNGREVMTIASLKRLICPNGQCDNLFDGYSMSDKVNVQDFISSITGEHGFGWGDWNGTHYNHIRTTSNAWGMKSPVINLAGGIPTNSNFKVGDFEKGTPNISFGSFVSMAESIFSRIPYKYYYDSAWKGSWLGALQAGACNCSDGADALIAFAHACNPNWSVSKQHGHWGKDGHFWAVINGKVMDTTAWQGGYGWTSPKVSGYGSPYVRRANPSNNGETQSGKTVNITNDFSNAVIYGVDDLDSKIQESVQKGLQKEFNDPYTVAI